MKLKDAHSNDRNVSDPKLPGNSLLDAIHNRRLMMLSDRGGASKHIGDQWASHVSRSLANSLNEVWHLPGDHAVRLLHILRLDENPNVEREANKHQLENPDFLIVGRMDENQESVLFAADAKFAADRIKTSQVSQEIVQQLIEVPEPSTVAALVAQTVEDFSIAWPATINGVFISPDSTMTDLLLARSSRREPGPVEENQIVRVSPHPTALFAGLPMGSIISTLARLDQLPVSPQSNLLAAVYYFRVSCACYYLWQEQHRPLFSGRIDPDEPDPAIVGGDVSSRASRERSAYDVIVRWQREIEEIIDARSAIQEVVRLPVTMREIRDAVAARHPESDREAHKEVVKLVRRDLEIAFRGRIIDETGEIAADDPRPLPAILKDVAAASRSLRRPMQELLQKSIEEHLDDGDYRDSAAGSG